MTLTLIVEDGSGLVNSNVYCDVAFADEYFLSHPYYADNWAALANSDKEILLYNATARLDDMYNWNGYVTFMSQALRWPRCGVYDLDNRAISQNVIPTEVKQAVCEYAYYLSTGNTEVASSTQGISELKVDVIELKFNGSTSLPAVPLPALRLLRAFGTLCYGSRVRKVVVS